MLIEGGNGEMYAQCRIPGIVMTEKNTLLAYYECRKSNSDWAQIDLKIIRSTDGGESWQTVGMIAGKGITLNNPVMLVKGDAIHFLFLKGYKNLYHCISRDDGIGNWQNLHFAPQMPDPICMGSMCHEKGMLYHINCNSQTARENLTVKISTDCFESYESIPVDTSGGYADMAVKDGVLYILHERDFNNGELHFRRLAP